MTMGKNFVSIKSIPVQKPKLMKLKIKKKKNIIRKFLGYLKSDTYLFAPLISQSRHRFIPQITTSTGVERADPVIKKKKQKVVEKLVDYLKSDYHMYAPLVVQEPCVDADKCVNVHPVEKAKTDMNRVEEVMKNVTDETRVPKHHQTTNGFTIETMRLDNGYPFGKTTGVKHTLLQKETVKHVIQPKRRLSSRGKKKKAG